MVQFKYMHVTTIGSVSMYILYYPIEVTCTHILTERMYHMLTSFIVTPALHSLISLYKTCFGLNWSLETTERARRQQQ